MDGWKPLQPLGASKEVSKSRRNGADRARCDRKVVSTNWGFHNKKHGKVCPQLPPIFPASTVLNVCIAGDTVKAILYRVKVMDIPSSVSHISLFCGTNNLFSDSPATISSTITEILFLLRRKCPTANIQLFPILPRFDHLKTHVASTNSCIYFQLQEFFPEFVFFHELPSALYNQNLYRADKLHLSTKGNEILVRWFHHCLTTSTSTSSKPNPPPMPSLQDVPPTFFITDTNWPPLPAPSQPTFSSSMQIQLQT